jgi:branched-chain amino acid transport system substrate-binding protein
VSGRRRWAPIKLGVLEPLSGPVKYFGDNCVAGLRFALERINGSGGVLGRELELVLADSELSADVAATRATDLVLDGKVDLLVVSTGSHVGAAVSQVAARHKKLFVSTGAEARELTGSEFFETTFRCCLNTDMHAGALAVYFARLASRTFTTFYLLHQDYNFGRAAAGGFKRMFSRIKAATQRIVGEEYHPLQTVRDFGPYIAKIMASGAEVVITSDWGQDLRLLLQDGASLGWQTTVGGFFLNDPTLLASAGRAAIGHATAMEYLVTVDTPENEEFLRAWGARYPDAPLLYRYPDFGSARSYYAATWLAEVIARAGSVETRALIRAWEGSRLRTAWGEVEMRAGDHQMLTPGYVAEIVAPDHIPPGARSFGAQFPGIGPATRIPKEDLTIPLTETGNPGYA